MCMSSAAVTVFEAKVGGNERLWRFPRVFGRPKERVSRSSSTVNAGRNEISYSLNLESQLQRDEYWEYEDYIKCFDKGLPYLASYISLDRRVQRDFHFSQVKDPFSDPLKSHILATLEVAPENIKAPSAQPPLYQKFKSIYTQDLRDELKIKAISVS
ncbi:hypothetical protein M501DRAFT_993145 [Patellaria atrata CBS 101060]|uniref:Uncharacterized protein n=1 Tax=Patellaria atrata CBS 101060 TaxID=1346257 RepID=A0A9P4VM80_9PEZI|nr:hypothetical protein M501DRAFT_993145 [Patellaria atrata CBS 101060]